MLWTADDSSFSQFTPPDTKPSAVDRKQQILSQRKIKGLIAEDRYIVIYDGRVLKMCGRIIILASKHPQDFDKAFKKCILASILI